METPELVSAIPLNHIGLDHPTPFEAAFEEHRCCCVISPVTSPLQGSATLTDAQAADLQAGRWYVNIHTAANPGGEVRGRKNVTGLDQ
jgi:hypothetical protein